MILLIIAVIGALVLYNTGDDGTGTQVPGATKRDKLPFRYDKVVLSRHAKERMDCRHISLQEIEAVLQSGRLNVHKSSPAKDSCKSRYAIEGISSDSQEIRVIAASCGGTLTIITVIDLAGHWTCD